MLIQKNNFLDSNKKLFLLILALSFTVFLFTSDGHRYTIDEDIAAEQTLVLVTQEPNPLFVKGESYFQFQYPVMFPHPSGPLCQNEFLCYSAYIGHTITQIPFIFINHNFNLITEDTVVLQFDDFDEPHYVYWRNIQNPDYTFLNLFYGPIFSSLSVATFYLVSRTFNYTQKTSIALTLIFGFSTPIWAYSQTSLNSVPIIFLILLSFFYFRKYQEINQKSYYLLFSGCSLGFGFLVRPDMILFIVPLIIFLIFLLRKQKKKIYNFLIFIFPQVLFYGIYLIVEYIKTAHSPFLKISSNVESLQTVSGKSALLHESIFGLLFSPGIGLLIFAPILLTIFFSFPDFFNKHKKECLLFLGFIAIVLVTYGKDDPWHGLIAWASRYILILIPFLLLPLGASIEKRTNKFFLVSIIVLSAIGFFFNIIHVIQDVYWFVWGTVGGDGLFGLATAEVPLYIHLATIWTFEFSQLTWSIVEAFENLQVDIYLFYLMGPIMYLLSFSIIVSILGYFILKNLKKSSNVT